jgi:hypothetical protein
MNLKYLVRSDFRLFERLPDSTWEGLRKTTKNALGMTGASAEIRKRTSSKFKCNLLLTDICAGG